MWSEFSVILQPSPIGGIGTFVTHNIAAGAQLFTDSAARRRLPIADVPEPFRKYCILLSDTECICPERFDRMEVGWFINHSFQPNISRRSDGVIVAVHDIRAGDELLVDYNQLQEPQHLKEAYYRQA